MNHKEFADLVSKPIRIETRQDNTELASFISNLMTRILSIGEELEALSLPKVPKFYGERDEDLLSFKTGNRLGVVHTFRFTRDQISMIKLALLEKEGWEDTRMDIFNEINSNDFPNAD